MAIEIIPKAEKKEGTFLKTFLSSVSIILLLIAIISTLVFWFLGWRSGRIAQETERKIEEKKTEDFLAMDAEVRQYQKKIDDYSSLLKAAKTPLKMLEIIEKNMHPRVILTGMKVDMSREEISADGVAENLVAYDQQVRIFKGAKDFKKVDISNFSIAEGGKINFPIIFSFGPEVYKR